MAYVLWVFYLSKVLDFMDTVFMVARRKWRQISFLHVYHHASIFLVYWLNLNAGYDGDIYFTVVLNGFIHFVMYGYYAVRTFNVRVPMAIKALITNAQMVQFVCMNLQAGYLLLNDCSFPRKLTWFYLGYIISMLVLFNDFSNKTYGKKKKDKSKKHNNNQKPDFRPRGSTREGPSKNNAAISSDSISDANEVLIGTTLYDVTDFKHPGGGVINFFTGQGDATETFREFHMRSTRAPKFLKALRSRP